MSSQLKHSPAAVLAELIHQLEYLSSGFGLYVNFRPSDSGYLCLLVTDTESRNIVKDQTGGITEAAGIQLRLRGLPHQQEPPRTILIGLADLLDTVARVQVVYDSDTTYRVFGIHRTSAILPLPTDENHCFEWTWNGVMTLMQLP